MLQWRTAAMLENIGNTITHLAMDRLAWNLAGRIPSRSWHVRHNAVAMATVVALQRCTGHSAVMGIWRPNAWTNFDEFGIRQQIRTTVTVTWSNIKIFESQNGGRSLLENSRNAITRLQMDRLGRNLGGRIPSCSQYWKCYNSSYDGTDWDDSWVVASKQHFCCKTVSLVFGRYC